MRALLLLVFLSLISSSVHAHRVLASVFPSGGAIEGEIGFSNGKMAVGETVIITGPDGEVLGEVITDEEGFFVFTPTEPVAHTFHADLGAGHVARVTMSAEEVARVIGVGVATPTPTPGATAQGATSQPLEVDALPLPGCGSSEAQRALIAEIVRDELRPLRREITALREHHGLQSILGGIGYILGIFGVGFYVAARRRFNA